MLKYAALCGLMLLCGCSSSGTHDNTLYGMMDNERLHGTVVSISKGSHLGVSGAGDAATAGAANAAGTAGASILASSTLLSPLSGSAGSVGNLFSTSSTSVDEVNELHYVVQLDDGTRASFVQVPDVNDPVVYPGQEVIIQQNGKYVKVYPADIEHRRSGN